MTYRNKMSATTILVIILCGLLQSCNSKIKKNTTLAVESTAAFNCRNVDTATLTFKKQPDLQEHILRSIKTDDLKQLVRVASCNFLLGPPNSDSGGFNRPEKMMRLFLVTAKNLKWSDTAVDYKTQRNLASVETEYIHELIFKKNKNQRWYWAGYTTSDHYIYHKMLENSSQLEPEINAD